MAARPFRPDSEASSETMPPGFGFASLPQKPLPPLEPGPWALTCEAVEAWMAKARTGDSLVYARGRGLLQSGGVRRLQELHDRGSVTFTTRRMGADDFAFIAERLAGDTRPSERAMLTVRGRSAETDDELAMLMAVLRRRVAKGRTCGTNRELGADMGDVGPDRVAYLLGLLIRERKIEVESLAKGVRVVTLLATGKQTARSE
jgi:hypothetical protein